MEMRSLLGPRPPCADAVGLGPTMTLRRLSLKDKSEEEKCIWLEEARISAIIGSCALSLKSVRSGINCYTAFIGWLSAT